MLQRCGFEVDNEKNKQEENEKLFNLGYGRCDGGLEEGSGETIILVWICDWKRGKSRCTDNAGSTGRGQESQRKTA